MQVTVDSYAWLARKDLSGAQLAGLRQELTVHPTKSDPKQDTPEPIELYRETPTHFGIAREFFYKHRRAIHEVVENFTLGNSELSQPFGVFKGELREEQALCLKEVVATLESGEHLGGIIRAVPGWGKTVMGCALAHRLGIPTLVIVHKTFLMDQWMEAMAEFVPEASIGRVQQDECDYQGKALVVGMVHSVAGGKYPQEFYDWPGLVIVDECHRMGARTWAPAPGMFKAKYRIGFSATPRRKDGADDVFYYHLGPLLFAAKEQRMSPKIRRVWTKFKFFKTDRFNASLAPRGIQLKFLCRSNHRNMVITEQIVEAARAGRKLLILSERREHLLKMEDMFRDAWPLEEGYAPVVDFYVGGRKKEELAVASEAMVIMATTQFAQEGLNIPALDTLFLTTPLSDVEQAVGRILRPFKGKKDPVVVDFRDDDVPVYKRQAQKRDNYYATVTS
jgi:superfamily II DNA or RNA helicase